MIKKLQKLIFQHDEFSLVCVTGPMAAGKNFVCSAFEQNGWISLDADKQVHGAIQKATPQIISAFGKLAEECGINLQNSDGTLNRRALGAFLFPRPELLAKQESIVYPIIVEETERFLQENKDQKIILNATVLFKIPELLNRCQRIIFVTAPFPIRLKRARLRDKMPFHQILSRFHSQRKLLENYRKTNIPVLIYRNNY